MAKASQIALRQEFVALDVQGIPIKVFFYPDRFSPHMMRQYAQILMLTNLVLTPGGQRKSDEQMAADLAHLQSGEDIERELLSKVDNVADMLCTLIASWDLEEDQEPDAPAGAMVALTRERLAKFGFAFLFLTLQLLMAEMKLLGETNGFTSNGHSPVSSGVKPRRKR